jgi:hypothetical protein
VPLLLLVPRCTHSGSKNGRAGPCFCVLLWLSVYYNSGRHLGRTAERRVKVQTCRAAFGNFAFFFVSSLTLREQIECVREENIRS